MKKKSTHTFWWSLDRCLEFPSILTHISSFFNGKALVTDGTRNCVPSIRVYVKFCYSLLAKWLFWKQHSKQRSFGKMQDESEREKKEREGERDELCLWVRNEKKREESTASNNSISRIFFCSSFFFPLTPSCTSKILSLSLTFTEWEFRSFVSSSHHQQHHLSTHYSLTNTFFSSSSTFQLFRPSLSLSLQVRIQTWKRERDTLLSPRLSLSLNLEMFLLDEDEGNYDL